MLGRNTNHAMPSAARIKRKRDEGMENNAKKIQEVAFPR
jgi:hypothetical protein